jgi:hypothetical protein
LEFHYNAKNAVATLILAVFLVFLDGWAACLAEHLIFYLVLVIVWLRGGVWLAYNIGICRSLCVVMVGILFFL